MMKDLSNLNNTNKNVTVSKDKIEILIREIKAKGKKITNVYNSFSEIQSCGYSLSQLYKLTEQTLKYKDTEYRFYTTMMKNSLFDWNNHDNVLQVAEDILKDKLLIVYFKYIKFKDNKIFNSLKEDLNLADLNLAINKISALLNNSFALLPPIYSNNYTEAFIESDIFNRNLSEEDLKNEVKRINYTINGSLITKYTKNNISYWIKGLIYRDKKNEAFNKYYKYENEILKQYKENIDCLNIFLKSFKFLKNILVDEEFASLSKYILNEDEFGLYLKDLCGKLIKYKNYLYIINQVKELDTETRDLLDFISVNTNSIQEGALLIKFIEKYYYYMLINELEKSNDYINDFKSVEEYFNILIKAVKFTHSLIDKDSNLNDYLNELFEDKAVAEKDELINNSISYDHEILSLLKSWGYKVITNYSYKSYTIKYVVCTKENTTHFIPIYFDSINNFNERNLKEILLLLADDKDVLFIWSHDWWCKRNSEIIRIRSFLNRIL